MAERASAPAKPAQPAGGKKILGLPPWAFWGGLAALGVGAYLWWRNRQAQQQQGGQGQPTAYPTIVDVFMENQGHQPHGKGKGGGGGKHQHPHPEGDHYETITVNRAQTFGQLAKYYHWDPQTINEIEEMNKVQGAGELTLSTELHPGETILRPVDSGP